MTTLLTPSSPLPVGEVQAKAEQNGGSSAAAATAVEDAPPQQQQRKQLLATPPPPASTTTTATTTSGSGVVARDTSSIPGVSMLAGQLYPPALVKHDEVVASKEVFLDSLNKFHSALGTRLTKKGRKGKERAAEVKTFQESLNGIPKLGGQDLDLHHLYVEVTSRGGLQQVIKDRKWKEVTTAFSYPSTTTSASYILRKYYIGLLHHFEQVYYFGATGSMIPPPISVPGPPSLMSAKRTGQAGALTYPLSEGEPGSVKRIRKRKILPIQAMPVVDPALSIGNTVTGAIEGKFEHGYLVTVMVAGEKLRGVLYHVPPGIRGPQHAIVPNYTATLGAELQNTREETNNRGQRRKRRRKEDMPKKDPNAPRPNRTGYNFFFAEQRTKLKALHPEKDKELSRMIGDAWNSLTEEEKFPYQDRGVKDKERYKQEMRDYWELVKLQKGVIPPELGSVEEADEAKVQDNIEAAADAATDAPIDGAMSASQDVQAAMDAEVQPTTKVQPSSEVPQEPVSVSVEPLKPDLENAPLHDLSVSPYVAPEEESFNAQGLEEEGNLDGAYG